jgi:hypothetical protein
MLENFQERIKLLKVCIDDKTIEKLYLINNLYATYIYYIIAQLLHSIRRIFGEVISIC